MKIKGLIFQIKSLSFKEALEYIVEKVQKRREKTFVVTINPEIIMLAKGNKDYENVLKSANLALPDGIGVIWAGKMFGKSFKERVHGSDLVDRLCNKVSKQPITVGFLGGGENVAQKTAERLTKKYPGLKVVFVGEEWGPEGFTVAGQIHGTKQNKTQNSRRNSELFRVPVQHSSAGHMDILFVAFGSPKQEMWIYENLPKINVRVAIGVGGAFDFISGKVKRAPVWVRSLGFEWLFRLAVQPWRARRQLVLIKFIFLVLKEKFFN